eukprot:gene25267-30511_t
METLINEADNNHVLSAVAIEKEEDANLANLAKLTSLQEAQECSLEALTFCLDAVKSTLCARKGDECSPVLLRALEVLKHNLDHISDDALQPFLSFLSSHEFHRTLYACVAEPKPKDQRLTLLYYQIIACLVKFQVLQRAILESPGLMLGLVGVTCSDPQEIRSVVCNVIGLLALDENLRTSLCRTHGIIDVCFALFGWDAPNCQTGRKVLTNQSFSMTMISDDECITSSEERRVFLQVLEQVSPLLEAISAACHQMKDNDSFLTLLACLHTACQQFHLSPLPVLKALCICPITSPYSWTCILYGNNIIRHLALATNPDAVCCLLKLIKAAAAKSAMENDSEYLEEVFTDAFGNISVPLTDEIAGLVVRTASSVIGDSYKAYLNGCRRVLSENNIVIDSLRKVLYHDLQSSCELLERMIERVKSFDVLMTFVSLAKEIILHPFAVGGVEELSKVFQNVSPVVRALCYLVKKLTSEESEESKPGAYPNVKDEDIQRCVQSVQEILTALVGKSSLVRLEYMNATACQKRAVALYCVRVFYELVYVEHRVIVDSILAQSQFFEMIVSTCYPEVASSSRADYIGLRARHIETLCYLARFSDAALLMVEKGVLDVLMQYRSDKSKSTYIGSCLVALAQHEQLVPILQGRSDVVGYFLSTLTLSHIVDHQHLLAVVAVLDEDTVCSSRHEQKVGRVEFGAFLRLLPKAIDDGLSSKYLAAYDYFAPAYLETIITSSDFLEHLLKVVSTTPLGQLEGKQMMALLHGVRLLDFVLEKLDDICSAMKESTYGSKIKRAEQAMQYFTSWPDEKSDLKQALLLIIHADVGALPSWKRTKAVAVSLHKKLWPQEAIAFAVVENSRSSAEALAESLAANFVVKAVEGSDSEVAKTVEVRWSFFLSHFQRNGGDAIQALHEEMSARGISSWYDNAAEEITADSMEAGVAGSAVFLLFLTDGVLTRPFCQLEIRKAISLQKPILLLWEADELRGGTINIQQHADQAPEDIRSVLFPGDGKGPLIVRMERFGRARDHMFVQLLEVVQSLQQVSPAAVESHQQEKVDSPPSKTIAVCYNGRYGVDAAMALRQSVLVQCSKLQLAATVVLQDILDIPGGDAGSSNVAPSVASYDGLVIYVTKDMVDSPFVQHFCHSMAISSKAVVVVEETEVQKGGLDESVSYREVLGVLQPAIQYKRREPFRSAMMKSLLRSLKLVPPILSISKDLDEASYKKMMSAVSIHEDAKPVLSVVEGFRPGADRRALLLRRSYGHPWVSYLLSIPSSKQDVEYVASYFVSVDDFRSRDPTVCVRSLSLQLCDSLPGFRDALQQLVGGDPADEAMLKGWDLRTLFLSLIIKPAAALPTPSSGKFLLIDNIDDLEGVGDRKRDLFAIIQRCWDQAPEWLGLIVASDADVIDSFRCENETFPVHPELAAYKRLLESEVFGAVEVNPLLCALLAARSRLSVASVETLKLASALDERLVVFCEYNRVSVVRWRWAKVVDTLSRAFGKELVKRGHALLAVLAQAEPNSLFMRQHGVFHMLPAGKFNDCLSYLKANREGKGEWLEESRRLYLSVFPDHRGEVFPPSGVVDRAADHPNGSDAVAEVPGKKAPESSGSWDLFVFSDPVVGVEQASQLVHLLESHGVAAKQLHSALDVSTSDSASAFVIFLTDQCLQDRLVQEALRLHLKQGMRIVMVYESLSAKGGLIDPNNSKINVWAYLQQAPSDLQTIFNDNECLLYERDVALAQAMTKRILQMAGIDRSGLPAVHFSMHEIPVMKAKDFVPGTRKWIFDAVDQWLANGESSNCFALVGAAGVGKSVVMAEFCRRNGESLKRFLPANPVTGRYNVVGYHFFKHDDMRLNSGRNAVLALGLQLCSNIPGFYNSFKTAMQSVDIDNQTSGDLLQKLIIYPTKFVSFSGLIVLDALDECNAVDRESLLRTIQTDWKDSKLKLIISTRPETYVPYLLTGFQPGFLDADDAQNLADVSSYLHARLTSLGVTESSLLKPMLAYLEESAQGLFLFLRFVDQRLSDLAGAGQLTLDSLKKLPRGIAGVYDEYFSRLLEEGFQGRRDAYVALLGPVLVARQPLPVDVWQSALLNTGTFTLDAFEKGVNQAQQLLYIANNTVRVVHKSMSDWILDEDLEEKARNNLKTAKTTSGCEHLSISPLEAHRVLGTFCDYHITSLLSESRGESVFTSGALQNPTVDIFAINQGFHHMTMMSSAQDLATGRARQLILRFDRLFLRVFHTASMDKLNLLMADLVKYRVVQRMGASVVDQAVTIVLSALRLALPVLQKSPRELASQMIGRINLEALDGTIDAVFLQDLQSFVEQARRVGAGRGLTWLCPKLKCSLQLAGGKMTNAIITKESIAQVSVNPARDQIAFGHFRKQAQIGDATVTVVHSITSDTLATLKIGQFGMPSHSTYAVAFSIDGKYLVAGAGHWAQHARCGSVSLWETDTFELVKAIKIKELVSCMQLSQDSSTLVVATDGEGMYHLGRSQDAKIKVFLFPSLEPWQQFEFGFGHGAYVSSRGELICSLDGGSDAIVVWDRATGNKLMSCPQKKDKDRIEPRLRSYKMLQRRASEERKAEYQKMIDDLLAPDPDNAVNLPLCCAFHPRLLYFFVIDTSGYVHVFKPGTWQRVNKGPAADSEVTEPSEKKWTDASAIDVTEDFVVICYDDASMAIMDVHTDFSVVSEFQTSHTQRISSVKVSPTAANIIVTSGYDGAVMLWDWRVPSLKVPMIESAKILRYADDGTSCLLSRSGQLAETAGYFSYCMEDGTCQPADYVADQEMWRDTVSGHEIHSVDYFGAQLPKIKPKAKGYPSRGEDALLDITGNVLFSSPHDIKCYDASTGYVVTSKSDTKLPYGETLVLEVWHCASRQLCYRFYPKVNSVDAVQVEFPYMLVFEPIGTRIDAEGDEALVSGYMMIVRLFDFVVLAKIENHRGVEATLSIDGKYVRVMQKNRDYDYYNDKLEEMKNDQVAEIGLQNMRFPGEDKYHEIHRDGRQVTVHLSPQEVGFTTDSPQVQSARYFPEANVVVLVGSDNATTWLEVVKG